MQQSLVKKGKMEDLAKNTSFEEIYTEISKLKQRLIILEDEERQNRKQQNIVRSKMARLRRLSVLKQKHF